MMTRITVIQEIINRKRAKTYLEIGVWKGKCFLGIRASRKIAVDPNLSISKTRKFRYCFRNTSNIFNKYYAMASDSFFETESEMLTRGRLDVVFIDGLHTFEQSLKDVQNSLKFLKEDGVIILHDCNPPYKEAALEADSYEAAEHLDRPGWTRMWCGDVWKTIAYLRSFHGDLNIFVVDCDWGVGVITRGKPKVTLGYSPEEIKRLSYQDLERDRDKILNLKSPQYFESLIRTFARPAVFEK